MATKVNLRERAAAKLGILTEARALSAYETKIIDEVIDEEQAFYEADGIAYWSLTSIPEGAMRGFVDVIAGRAAPRLKDAQSAAPYTSLVQIGEKALREFTAFHGPNMPVETDYF